MADIQMPPERRPGARRRQPPLELVGRSAVVERLRELVRRAAALEGGVLIVAEPGCDAEPIAHELHTRSRRAGAPYLAIECASGAPLDDLLFGTPGDASSDVELVSGTSRIAAAAGGTLLLQSLTELPSMLQGRLARVTRDGEVRLAADGTKVAVRIIASASSEIDQQVDAGHFRQDLFRRLSALRIDVPPLRERRDDIADIAAGMLAGECAAHDVPARAFTDSALALVSALTWPGNMSELRGVIGRVVSDTAGDVVGLDHLLAAMPIDRPHRPAAPTTNLRDARLSFERDYIASVLQHHGWRMADAARTLGIQRPNLYRKARQLGIPIPKPE